MLDLGAIRRRAREAEYVDAEGAQTYPLIELPRADYLSLVAEVERLTGLVRAAMASLHVDGLLSDADVRALLTQKPRSNTP